MMATDTLTPSPSPTGTPSPTDTLTPSPSLSPTDTYTPTITPTSTYASTPIPWTPAWTPSLVPTMVETIACEACNTGCDFGNFLSKLITVATFGLVPLADIKTVGLGVSGEGSFILSGGGSGALLFGVDESKDIGTCKVFGGVEGGFGIGLDPIQAGLPSLIISTASLDEFSGATLNFSGDIVYLGGGISVSLDNKCNFTSMFGLSLGSLPTGSATLGSTGEVLSCDSARDLLQTLIR